MVGGAPAVLTRARATALVLLLAALALYDALAGHLPEMRTAYDVAFVAIVLIPAMFSVVWLALPLATAKGLPAVAVALGVLAIVLYAAGLDAVFNVAKLMAYVLAGLWLLTLFEALSWVVLISLVIPGVDAISVWRGPTDYVVSEQPSFFDRVSIAFRVPGEDSSANLGPPDVVFFALFLAAAVRFGLRAGWTWVCMTALLSLTLVVTASTDIAGLPALPAVCLGFLLPNADLLWRRLRPRRAGAGPHTPAP
jgi:hypothetical protein